MPVCYGSALRFCAVGLTELFAVLWDLVCDVLFDLLTLWGYIGMENISPGDWGAN